MIRAISVNKKSRLALMLGSISVLLTGCQTNDAAPQVRLDEQNKVMVNIDQNNDVAVQGYVPAKVIENDNSTMPGTTANLSRVEGWALLSYIVGVDGKPQQVIVINKSAKGDFVAPSIRYLNGLHFSPATDQGQPVPSAKTLFMRHGKSFYNTNNEGISPGFRQLYNDANELLINKTYEQAKPKLDELDADYAKNLTEQALSAWLLSKYYANQERWPEYGEQVLIASQLRQHLPVKMAVQATLHQFEWYKFQKQYADAIVVLRGITNIKDTEMDEETRRGLLAPVLKAMKAEPVAKMTTLLTQDKAWLHLISRSTISLDFNANEGAVELVELRCDNALHQFALSTVESKIEGFDIPADYRNCSVLVKGSAGTEVVFTEQGDKRRF